MLLGGTGGERRVRERERVERAMGRLRGARGMCVRLVGAGEGELECGEWDRSRRLRTRREREDVDEEVG